jgi:hypothetical protein
MIGVVAKAIFKIFRIPVNKWTLPTAALGGLFLIYESLARSRCAVASSTLA